MCVWPTELLKTNVSSKFDEDLGFYYCLCNKWSVKTTLKKCRASAGQKYWIIFHLFITLPSSTHTHISLPLKPSNFHLKSQMATGTAMIWECFTEIFICNQYYSHCIEIVKTKFCICHDSTGIVTCAKFCYDHAQTWILKFRAVSFCKVSSSCILLVKRWTKCLPWSAWGTHDSTNFVNWA